MSLVSKRHLAVLGELTEWWEDLCQGGIGSQVVLLPVPAGWGRSFVLERLRAVVEDVDAPIALLVWIDGRLPPVARCRRRRCGMP